jgi:hypothetical protein
MQNVIAPLHATLRKSAKILVFRKPFLKYPFTQVPLTSRLLLGLMGWITSQTESKVCVQHALFCNTNTVEKT